MKGGGADGPPYEEKGAMTGGPAAAAGGAVVSNRDRIALVSLDGGRRLARTHRIASHRIASHHIKKSDQKILQTERLVS